MITSNRPQTGSTRDAVIGCGCAQHDVEFRGGRYDGMRLTLHLVEDRPGHIRVTGHSYTLPKQLYASELEGRKLESPTKEQPMSESKQNRGDVEQAIQLLREGLALSVIARRLPVTSYRMLQKAIKQAVGGEEYRLLMQRKGKTQDRQQRRKRTPAE